MIKCRMRSGWQSYDSAGEIHQKIAVPLLFGPPARDLVKALGIRASERVLDAGAGTGVATRLAAEAAGAGAVIAFDSAFGMIREARREGAPCALAATLPRLPFRDESFDCAMAGFVLSHMDSPESGAAEIYRVLRGGGRFAATSWATLETPFRQAWYEVAASFVPRQAIEDAARQGVPREEQLSSADGCAELFRGAGFRQVSVERRSYCFRFSTGDFLAMRENAMQGRFLRQRLDTKEWDEFRAAAAREFQRFAEPIEENRDVLITLGIRA